MNQGCVVVIAGGLIGSGDGAKAHFLPRVDEAFILQRLPPRTTSAADPPVPLRHCGHAGVGVDQLLLGLLLLRITFVLVGLFFILFDGGFVAVAMAYEAGEDLGAVNLYNK
jgi:hypothetical protein